MISDSQMPQEFREIINTQMEIYRDGQSIQVRREIPETTLIPIENPNHWIKIPGVICVFVDMKGSTQLSATTHDRSTAGAYQLFTGTAVRLFARFETPYIDVRGDGVFGLFNANQVYRALAAAVTFKTFCAEVFVPKIKDKTGLDVGGHFGIDQKTVLVRKLGLKRHSGRTDRQNEVWAGKPVNMASKLAAAGSAGDLLVSDRFYERITHEVARKSCGCPNGQKVELWEKREDASQNPIYDFNTIYSLRAPGWCKIHGDEYCRAMLDLDD